MAHFFSKIINNMLNQSQNHFYSSSGFGAFYQFIETRTKRGMSYLIVQKAFQRI
jgi:hypothetical protein